MRVAKIRLAPILGVVIAAALCTGAWPALAGEPAQVAKKKKLTCKRLKKSKDLAPARKVRLVRRRNRDGGTDLLGCVLPKGTVRLVASSANQTTREGYSLRQVAGAVVLIDASSGNQYATSRGTSVFNIRTGKSYSVARSCFGSPCSSTGVTAASAFVNKLGQATAALASQDEAPSWVMAPP